MRKQMWIGGHAVAVQVPDNGRGGLIDAVPAGSTPFGYPGGGYSVPGTAFSGLAVPHGRIFTLRGSTSAYFHVAIPFERAFPVLIPQKKGSPAPRQPPPLLRRVFFKYYCFLHSRNASDMSRVSSVRAFDAGRATGPWGALSAQGNPNGMPGFQLENFGATDRDVVPKLSNVDKIRRGVNVVDVADYSEFEGPVNLEITVTRDTENMIYGSICFVAFGIEYFEQ